jgi:ABC-type xylose transport system substrate-binding protein
MEKNELTTPQIIYTYKAFNQATQIEAQMILMTLDDQILNRWISEMRAVLQHRKEAGYTVKKAVNED